MTRVLLCAAIALVSLASCLRLRLPANIIIPDVIPETREQKISDMRGTMPEYIGGRLVDQNNLFGQDDPIGLGDIEGRDEQLQARLDAEPVVDIENGLKEEGWVPDELESIKGTKWKPYITNAERERLANLTIPDTATVEDGIRRDLNLTEMDPQEPPTKWMDVRSEFPSQFDPVTPVGVKYSNGDISRNERLIYPGRGGIVRSDPIKLSEPPMELSQPPKSPFTRDIKIETRGGGGNEFIGEPEKGWDDAVRGNRDSRMTRVLDPTIPEEKLHSLSDSAVNDYDPKSTFGADEVANLSPARPPFEESPVELERSPIREGMEKFIRK